MTTYNEHQHQNNIKRNREGRFIQDEPSVSKVRRTPTEQWKKYTRESGELDKNTLYLLEAKHKEETLQDTEGLLSVLGFMDRIRSASMAHAREARVANMINIATHKEYFNKTTVARAYLEIEDYIHSDDDSVEYVRDGGLDWAKLIEEAREKKEDSN